MSYTRHPRTIHAPKTANVDGRSVLIPLTLDFKKYREKKTINPIILYKKCNSYNNSVNYLQNTVFIHVTSIRFFKSREKNPGFLHEKECQKPVKIDLKRMSKNPSFLAKIDDVRGMSKNPSFLAKIDDVRGMSKNPSFLAKTELHSKRGLIISLIDLSFAI